MDSQHRDEFRPRGRQETLARRLGDALDQVDSRNAGACPEGDILAAYAERGLGQAETEKWDSHFATCSRCRKILQVLAVSEDTPLAEKEVARLGELISASRAPIEIAESVAKRGRSRIALWRTRWLAPVIGVAAVLAVWVALRPPWRATDRGASENLVAQAPKEELPISPPPETLDRLSKSATQQDHEKTPAIPPAESPARALAQNSPAEPSAKFGADVASRLDGNNLRAREENKPSLQSDKKTGSDIAGNKSPALAPSSPPANPSQTASEVPAAPQAQANAATSAATPAPAPAGPGANAVGNAGDRDRQAPLQQQSAGAMVAPSMRTPLPTPAQKSRNIVALKSADATTVQATAPFGSTAWRMGKGGKIERSGDSGETWIQQTSPSQDDWLAAVAISDTVCWVAGRNGAIARTTDGDNWQRVALPAQVAGPDGKLPDWTGLTARNAQSATITANDGRKFSTADGGKTWQPQ